MAEVTAKFPPQLPGSIHLLAFDTMGAGGRVSVSDTIRCRSRRLLPIDVGFLDNAFGGTVSTRSRPWTLGKTTAATTNSTTSLVQVVVGAARLRLHLAL